MTAQWSLQDPTAVDGSGIEKKAASVKAFNELLNRISIFVNLPIASLDRLKLQEQLDLIGISNAYTIQRHCGVTAVEIILTENRNDSPM
ncbi:MAG: hypothetical protein JAY97_09910 [Candidatus Thiodiazotropha sp. 'RUGA']|nr:hypothetical protein [Candidatus Thiodiazotropha sp. 'RUGA']